MLSLKPIASASVAASLLAMPSLFANDPAFTFTTFGVPISENFNAYRGTEATLPSDIFVGWDLRISDPYQGVNTGAFTAYTSDEEDYSFGIRERNPVDLRDGRVFLPIKNNTGQPIRYFEVSYDVEAWFIGDRRNRLRLKFDRFLTPAESGGRATFEEDVFSTDNPSTELTPGTAVDGSLPQNRVTISGIVDLENYSDGAGGFMGSIEPGDTAWFRWQVSNATGDDGNLRSGLAVNNVVITPLESFTQLEWKPGVGGSGVWQTAGGSDWSDGPWQQGAAALVGGSAGTITLDGAIEAFSIEVDSPYQFEANSGASLFSDTGITVSNGITAGFNVPIRADGQLRKIGGGTLVVGGAQSHQGGTLVAGGTLRTDGNDVLSANAPVVISPGAVLDLDGTSQTTGALIGERGGLVQLGNGGTLIIDTTSGGGAYRADLEGNGNVIIRSTSAQRFRSEKKLYTGFTRIEQGVLEVTGNGEMTQTSFIDVMPGGELFFVGDSSSGPPAGFGGPIQLQGGRLAMQNINDEALYFVDVAVDVQEPDSTINVSGAESVMILDSFFDGVLQGSAPFRKTGAGAMELSGFHPHDGGIELRNGSIMLELGATLGAGPMTFPLPENHREFRLEAMSHTVTLLDGDAPSQNDPEVENTLVLDIVNPGATFTVDQAIQMDEEENEITTRFQGDIRGAGDFVKSGSGFLAFTRWAKSYTGATRIEDGVLAISGSGAPGATSGVIVGDGGQLRLTSGGDAPSEVIYGFGGPITLEGGGRDASDVPEASGLGMLGALRFEPGIGSATIANDVSFVATEAPVGLHISTAGNQLLLAGVLSGAGGNPIVKSGGGELRVVSQNPGLTLPWQIQTGTLNIALNASVGGSVTVTENTFIAGSGTIGGSLTLEEGGSLATTGTGTLNVSGTFTAAENAQVFVSDIPASASTIILTATGGITGGDHLAVTGLEGTGITATLEVVGNNLVLNTDGAAGLTFAAWAGGVGADTDVNGNGIPALLEFALGATAPGAPVTRPVQGTVDIDGQPYLSLTAFVRTNAPMLSVVGETSIDLGGDDPWSPDDVDFITTGNTEAPANTEERIYRTPMNGPARFLRLRATEGSL